MDCRRGQGLRREAIHTFGGYARALRFIASEILETPKNKRRFSRTQTKDYRRGIDAALLCILSPEDIQLWKIRYVQKAGENPARQRAARISANSALRQAKALFSRKLIKFVAGVAIPEPLPFAGVEFFPRESMRYHSRLDPSELLKAASNELIDTDPAAFKALLLALGAGLRRGEIDRLLWRQIDFNAGVIRIEATEAGGLKTDDSAGAVPIDERLVAILRGLKAKVASPYVLGEGAGVTISKPWGQRYRSGDRLTQWLREHGVEGAKPIHTLRKEAGSLVATEAGIHAASRFLRHADIQITSACYADHKERGLSGSALFLARRTWLTCRPGPRPTPYNRMREQEDTLVVGHSWLPKDSPLRRVAEFWKTVSGAGKRQHGAANPLCVPANTDIFPRAACSPQEGKRCHPATRLPSVAITSLSWRGSWEAPALSAFGVAA